MLFELSKPKFRVNGVNEIKWGLTKHFEKDEKVTLPEWCQNGIHKERGSMTDHNLADKKLKRNYRRPTLCSSNQETKKGNY